uniref:Uncharacterized protein n=1 Tax=Paramoeba aestuarina TaxID=180227 RepID=A0A7S4L170_9EUKA|mmetsp:Transcript_29739/g.45976  ORF Transcript_29739/g.45976 Transcript_29739/m.45976 type:complete len:226 (+) Transcript_29739:36-713(+)
MFPSVFLLLTVDPHVRTIDQLQQTLLVRVFEYIEVEFRDRIPLTLPVTDVAFYEGGTHFLSAPRDFELLVSLRKTPGFKKIWKLRMVNWENIGNIQLDFLPQTVTHLEVSHCKQSFELHTRCFPRDSKSINLRSNAIYGSIDLQNLPLKIEYLVLNENRLRGEISLFALPDTLRELNLRANDFQQKRVYFGELPDSIRRISVKSRYIREVVPISKEYKEKISVFE